MSLLHAMTHEELDGMIKRRDAEIARLRAESDLLRKEVDAHLRANSDLVDKLHAARAEQPRTDAEWKAADRRKRINDLAARYAGQLAFACDQYHPDQTPLRVYRGIVQHARAIATEIVEAEE